MSLPGDRAATELTELYRTLLRAIDEALDLPQPGFADSDRDVYAHTLERRTAAVLATAKWILGRGAGNTLVVDAAADTLRETTSRLPVAYRTLITEAQPHEDVCLVCGPGCCSPVLGVHDSCPGPAAGRVVTR
jgi:hypothetical protein